MASIIDTGVCWLLMEVRAENVEICVYVLNVFFPAAETHLFEKYPC